MKTTHYVASVRQGIRPVLVAFLLLILFGANGQMLTGVDPDEGMQGEILELTISGQNTNFMQATSVSVNLMQGSSTLIFPEQISIASNQTLYATFGLSFTYDPGFYDMRVINEIDGQMVLGNAFQITNNPQQPQLVGIDPDTGIQGEELDVMISGQFTHFQASSTTVALQQGAFTIFPESQQSLSNTEITANFVFDISNPAGLYDLITFNQIDGELMLNNSFTLFPEDAPTLTGIDPPTGQAGDMYGFDIYGENTHFEVASAIEGYLENAGGHFIDLDFTIWSNVHLEGIIVIPYSAPTGNYDLHVWNNIDGSLSISDAVNIEPAGNTPEILFIEPDSAYRGESLQIEAFADHTWFAWVEYIDVWMKRTGSTEIISGGAMTIEGNGWLTVDFSMPVSGVAGDYDFYIEDEIDGEMVKVGAFYLIDTVVGINPVARAKNMALYPNPAQDRIFIDSPGFDGTCDIVIYNLSGQKKEIADVRLYPETSLEINIEDLNQGFYFIHVLTKEEIIVKKLIKN